MPWLGLASAELCGYNNVNLSVCALEEGMLQPEALSKGSLLTVAPLLLIVRMGNHANGMCKSRMHIILYKWHFESCHVHPRVIWEGIKDV